MIEVICVNGDCDSYAITKDGCYVVEAEDGRKWFCYEPETDLVEELERAKEEIKAMQAVAYRLGFAVSGTHLTVVIVSDRSVIPQFLKD